MNKKTWNVIKKILRFLLPALLGWLEGDTKVVADALASILFMF